MPHLLDDDALADPSAALVALHAGPPVLFDDRLQAWLVVSDAAVRAALLEPALSARAVPPFFDRLDPARRAEVADLEDHYDRWMIFSDGPGHTAPRAALRGAYSARAVAVLDPALAELVAEVSSGVPAGVRVDLLTDYARPIATGVAGLALEVLPADRPRVVEQADRLMAFLMSDRPRLELVDGTRAALRALTAYVERELAARRTAISRAVAGLELPSAVAAYAQVLTGSIDPVSAAIAGLATVSPEQLAHAESDVVEEMLRRDTVFRLAPRRAAADVTLAGTTVPAGARVLLLLHGANRDPVRHPEPAAFRPGVRRAHLAFGAGNHHCLGAVLARAVLRHAVRDVRRRGLQPGGPVVPRREFGVSGPASAPVCFAR